MGQRLVVGPGGDGLWNSEVVGGGKRGRGEYCPWGQDGEGLTEAMCEWCKTQRKRDILA